MPTYNRPGVFVEEVPSAARPIEGVATSVLGVVGAFKKGDLDGKAHLVTSWGQFEQDFGGMYKTTEHYQSPHAVFQWFNNGGASLYVARIDSGNPATATKVLNDDAGSPAASLTINAKNAGAWGNKLSVAVTHSNLVDTTLSAATGTSQTITVNAIEGVQVGQILKVGTEFHAVASFSPTDKSITLTRAISGNQAQDLAVASQDFNIYVYDDGSLVESWENMSYGGKSVSGDAATANKSGPTYVGTVITSDTSKYITVADSNNAVVYSAGNQPYPNVTTANLSLASGTDGTAPSALAAASYASTWLPMLDNADAVTLVIAPDAYVQSGDAVGAATGMITINNAVNSYCESRQDCFGILGTFYGQTAAQAVTSTSSLNGISYSAVYYPWIKVGEPLSNGTIWTPPVGAIAGVYARTDQSRGVHKAPAGQEAVTKGVIELKTPVTNALNSTLLPAKINPVRFFQGAGNLVWGTRTLAVDASWKYVPVRRLLIYIEESILKGIQWSVFEPNDTALWAKLRLNISAFLMNTFRAGALAGTKPSEAFYVNCDSATNPQSLIDAGQVNVEVGVAPVKPAEFVIVKIGLWDGGKLLSEIG